MRLGVRGLGVRGLGVRGLGVRGAGVPALPPLRIALSRPVPAVAVRLLPGGSALLTGVLLQPGRPVWLLVVVTAVLLGLRPGVPVAAGFLLLTGLVVLAGDDLLAIGGRAGSATWRLAGMLLTGQLVLVGAALASRLGRRGQVEAAVLLGMGRGVLGVQAAAQSMLLLGWWARAGFGTPDVAAFWWRVAAVAAVVLTALLVLPRRDRDTRP
jgi:hypothetical protein